MCLKFENSGVRLEILQGALVDGPRGWVHLEGVFAALIAFAHVVQ